MKESSQPKYRRILLKLSGEALGGESGIGIRPEAVQDMAEQIREQSTWKRPLLVAITGRGMTADRLRSQEVGIDLHLVKPVEPAELEHLLKRFRRIIGSSERSVAAPQGGRGWNPG